MLYARLDDKFHWPAEWDMVESMFDFLNRMTFGYQLNMERKMFQTDGPEYRCTLVKWAVENGVRVRIVLLETSDICQMKATLFMLINEAKQEGKNRKMSMVP